MVAALAGLCLMLPATGCAASGVGPVAGEGLGITLLDYVSGRAHAGDPEAQNLLALLLFTGEHAPVNREAAVAWFGVSAARGNPAAQANLSLLHHLGHDVAQDPLRAEILMARARAHPNAPRGVPLHSPEALAAEACAPTPSADVAEEVYGTFCAGCHGWNGIATYRGSPSFALGERLEKTDAELLDSVRRGLGTMPAWDDKLPDDWLTSTLVRIRRFPAEFRGGVLHRLRAPPPYFFRFGPMASDWAQIPHAPSAAWGAGVPAAPDPCRPHESSPIRDDAMYAPTSLILPAAVLGAIASAPTSAQPIAVPDSLPPGVTVQMVVEGREVFEGRGMCHTCHGPEAGGLLGPDLRDPDWWYGEGSYLAIVRQVLVGVPESQSTIGVAMPAMGGADLTDSDVQAVAAFVWRVSHPEAVDSLPDGVTPQMVARGDGVFHGAGRCFTCHAEDATGALGPSLTDGQWLHAKGSYLQIIQQVLVGVPAARSRTGIEMPPRGGTALSDADVQHVAAYVWALSRAEGQRP